MEKIKFILSWISFIWGIPFWIVFIFVMVFMGVVDSLKKIRQSDGNFTPLQAVQEFSPYFNSQIDKVPLIIPPVLTTVALFFIY